MPRTTKKLQDVRTPRRKTKRQKDMELGESIAKVMTGLWNSQKNPGKVYIGGHRIHHGAVGLVGALASAYLNKPAAYGFFKHLMDDDRHDEKEWFAGERLPPPSS